MTLTIRNNSICQVSTHRGTSPHKSGRGPVPTGATKQHKLQAHRKHQKEIQPNLDFDLQVEVDKANQGQYFKRTMKSQISGRIKRADLYRRAPYGRLCIFAPSTLGSCLHNTSCSTALTSCLCPSHVSSLKSGTMSSSYLYLSPAFSSVSTKSRGSANAIGRDRWMD